MRGESKQFISDQYTSPTNFAIALSAKLFNNDLEIIGTHSFLVFHSLCCHVPRAMGGACHTPELK
jgi:hypothetical protein